MLVNFDNSMSELIKWNLHLESDIIILNNIIGVWACSTRLICLPSVYTAHNNDPPNNIALFTPGRMVEKNYCAVTFF